MCVGGEGVNNTMHKAFHVFWCVDADNAILLINLCNGMVEKENEKY